MSHHDSTTEHLANSAAGGAPDEQTRLEEAMRRADELLLTSLKSEERRRNRRRRVMFLIGGLAMLTILCVLLFAVTGSDKAEKAAQLSQKGLKLWQEQKLDEAVEKFEEAVKLDPKNVNAWNGLGWSRFNSGDSERADTAFKKVIELEPKHPAALNGLGQLALSQRKYDVALKYLLESAPQAPAAWYGLARLYLLKGNWGEAAKWLRKIVDSGEADETVKEMLEAAEAKKLPADLRQKIEPPHALSPAAAARAKEVQRAWQFMNQGRRNEAKTTFEAVLKKSPKDANALNGLGWLLLNGGQVDEAKTYFEKAIIADPKAAAGAMNGLARVLQAQGDLEGAMKLWEEMVEKFPGPHAGTYGLANAYLTKQEPKKALPLLEQLVKANPNDEDLKAKLTKAQEIIQAEGKE